MDFKTKNYLIENGVHSFTWRHLKIITSLMSDECLDGEVFAIVDRGEKEPEQLRVSELTTDDFEYDPIIPQLLLRKNWQ